MKKKQIPIAIIGAGRIAEEYIKVLKLFKTNFKIKGIYSRTKLKSQKIAKKYQIPIVSESIDDLFKSTNAKGVIIAVSIVSTGKVLKKVMNYSWKSLVEKPIGLNFFQSSKLSKLAKKRKHFCYAALNRNFYSSVMNLKKIINKKKKFKRLIVINDQEDLVKAKKNGHNKKVLDNWMYANSIHLIDLFRIFARGKVKKVENLVKFNSRKPNLNFSKLKFTSGDKGFYRCIWNKPSPWSVELFVGNDHYQLKPIEYLTKIQNGHLKKYPISKKDLQYKPGFYSQTEEFLNILKKKEKKSCLPTIHDSLVTMKNIKNIYLK